MSEFMQVSIGCVFLAGVYVLTRYGIVWRIRRAYGAVLQDLQRRQALDERSAAILPYAQRNILNIGLRDFRHKALPELVAQGLVGRTADGRYYLRPQGREQAAP